MWSSPAAAAVLETAETTGIRVATGIGTETETEIGIEGAKTAVATGAAAGSRAGAEAAAGAVAVGAAAASAAASAAAVGAAAAVTPKRAAAPVENVLLLGKAGAGAEAPRAAAVERHLITCSGNMEVERTAICAGNDSHS